MKYLTRRYGGLLSSLLAVTLLTACNPASQTTDRGPAPTVHVNITIVATAAGLSSPTGTPASTPAPTATGLPPAASVPGQCPAVRLDAPAPQKPQSFADITGALVAYLNAGAGPHDVERLLISWGAIATLPNPIGLAGGVVTGTMLTGADPQVVAAYIDNSQPQTPSHRGDVLVLTCGEGRYSVIYQASSDRSLSGPIMNPRILAVRDVTGAGPADLTFSMTDCGVDTCYSGIAILSAINGALHNVIPGFAWIPAPVFDFSTNGVDKSLSLNVHPGFLSSPGAGPQRAVTETWQYEDGVYTRTLVTRAPPVYRIHALQDGDAAFRSNDLSTAKAIYQRVINDPTLQAYQGNAPLRDEAQILGAFARFRLMEIAAISGDDAGVQAAYAGLAPAAGGKSPTALYVELADAFMGAYQQARNYAVACDAAVKYAQRNKNVFLILGQDTFGAANQDYQADDMCIVPGK